MAPPKSSFKKAVKSDKLKARIAIIGPSGSGKTWGALELATGLVGPGGTIAVIDTENGTALLYSDRFEFDHAPLEDRTIQNYIRLIKEAERAGYGAIIVDNGTHAWEEALKMVDESDAKSSYTAWRDITPVWKEFIDAILFCKAHIIVTMRQKTDTVLDRDDRGKVTPKKVGTKANMRDGFEYEFDITMYVRQDHRATISKTRMPALDGRFYDSITRSLGAQIAAWLKNDEGSVQPAETQKVCIREWPKPPGRFEYAIDDVIPSAEGTLEELRDALLRCIAWTIEYGLDAYGDSPMWSEQAIMKDITSIEVELPDGNKRPWATTDTHLKMFDNVPADKREGARKRLLQMCQQLEDDNCSALLVLRSKPAPEPEKPKQEHKDPVTSPAEGPTNPTGPATEAPGVLAGAPGENSPREGETTAPALQAPATVSTDEGAAKPEPAAPEAAKEEASGDLLDDMAGAPKDTAEPGKKGRRG